MPKNCNLKQKFNAKKEKKIVITKYRGRNNDLYFFCIFSASQMFFTNVF